MKRRNWNSKEKSQIVLEGLRSQTSVNELCVKYGITQAQYYSWRDRFLSTCHEAFETGRQERAKGRLMVENSKLKKLVGELTLELKKNEYEL